MRREPTQTSWPPHTPHTCPASKNEIRMTPEFFDILKERLEDGPDVDYYIMRDNAFAYSKRCLTTADWIANYWIYPGEEGGGECICVYMLSFKRGAGGRAERDLE